MDADVKMILYPFGTPNFARGRPTGGEPADYGSDGVAIPLAAVDAYTLERLCAEFTEMVFKKAGKQRPPSTVERS